ncbi:MarR family transcriptional regulator [Lacrimispora sp. BS-2]|uniref:MarR family transcriptional regulator n=1 Tax=Lacrimispora sp. BS-2 TaxID=3151850 RepID=A0AAU7PSV6_9FIRM
MNKRAAMLINGQRVKRLYEKQFEETRMKYQISQSELDILAFLANNPEYDTASDIVEIRMIAKSYVSTSVESLITKGLLERVQDQNDRRVIHLNLTEKTTPIITDIRLGQAQVLKLLFAGMTNDEIELFEKLLERIFDNADAALER